MRTPLIVLNGVGAAILSFAAEAQPAAYARGAQDTLRYREVMRTETLMEVPRGRTVSRSIDREAAIAVVLLPGDTARAWFEALHITERSSDGVTRPVTDAVLQQPFLLGFDARGRTTLVAAPTAPANIARLGNLSRQFDDFFLRLPLEPLRVGLAWADTLVIFDSMPGMRAHFRKVASYRVAGDTTVADEPALVIAVSEVATLRTSEPAPSRLQLYTRLAGNGNGWIVFAPKSGRMLARERNVELRGRTNLSDGHMSVVSFDETRRYAHRIELVK